LKKLSKLEVLVDNLSDLTWLFGSGSSSEMNALIWWQIFSSSIFV